MTQRSIQHNGKELSYSIDGTGEPVVLIHGFAEDGNIWNSLIPALSSICTLIIPDLPGSGKSELIDDVSIDSLADSIKAILKEEKLKKVILIGHSMGGYITLALVEKNPALIKAFGLFHSTSLADTEEKILIREKAMSFIRNHGSFAFLQQTIPGMFSENFRGSHVEVINNLVEANKDFSPHALITYYQAMIKRTDRTKVLMETDKPVIFIIGKYDNVIPFDHSLRICHLPSLSYIHILENSGHMGMLEQSEKCSQALASFIKDLSLYPEPLVPVVEN